MEKLDSQKNHSKKGSLLIDGMLSLIIISFTLSFCFQMIHHGNQSLHLIENQENWLNLITNSHNLILEIPSAEELKSNKISHPIFANLVQLQFVKNLSLDWEALSSPNDLVILFQGETLYGEKIEWKIFRSF